MLSIRQTRDNLVDGDFSRFQAITADHQHADLSGKYSFIPTTRVIDVLGSMGWAPVQAAEMKCRNEARRGFQKHLLRFRNDALIIPGSSDIIRPEIVLTNSHDGLASFNLMAGLFRLVCSNGLIIADSTFSSHRIRHMGYTDQAVKEAVEAVCDTVPKIAGKVSDFQAIELTKDEQGVYAMAALQAKYGDETEKREFLPALLTASRRSADNTPTLWNTFNSVQEKLIKGGKYEVKTPFENHPAYKRPVKARAVNSISENVRINQALWMLTEKMAELKTNNIAPASLEN